MASPFYVEIFSQQLPPARESPRNACPLAELSSQLQVRSSE